MSEKSGSTTIQNGGWSYLRTELASRTGAPAKNVPFVIYVFLGPFLFGGLGIWVELVKLVIAKDMVEYGSLITAIITFFPALGCSTALQLVLASAGKNDKVLISFALLMLFVFLAPAVLLQFFSAEHPGMVLLISTLCSLGAVWLWWITNGSDPTYMAPEPDAATGGAVGRPLPGNLNGFDV